MTDLSTLRLFATQPHPCSYLDEVEATSVFVDPDHPIDKALYSNLSERGFRRSGPHLYIPRCDTCNACVPTRIPADSFVRTRKQRKCWNRNQDLLVSSVNNIQSEEHYNLYAKYISVRHKDGDMYPPSKEQYLSFLTSEWGVTEYLEFRLDGTLIAVAVTDRLQNGYSAVYTFYDPTHDKRSLGVFAVLWQIHMVNILKLESLYLGYWIKECAKMKYKTEYRPLEMLIEGRWLRIK